MTLHLISNVQKIGSWCGKCANSLRLALPPCSLLTSSTWSHSFWSHHTEDYFFPFLCGGMQIFVWPLLERLSLLRSSHPIPSTTWRGYPQSTLSYPCQQATQDGHTLWLQHPKGLPCHLYVMILWIIEHCDSFLIYATVVHYSSRGRQHPLWLQHPWG